MLSNTVYIYLDLHFVEQPTYPPVYFSSVVKERISQNEAHYPFHHTGSRRRHWPGLQLRLEARWATRL